MSLSDAPAKMLVDVRTIDITAVTTDIRVIIDALKTTSVPNSGAYMSKCRSDLCGRCAASQYGGKYRCPNCGRLIRPNLAVSMVNCVCGCVVTRCALGLIFGATIPIPGCCRDEDMDII